MSHAGLPPLASVLWVANVLFATLGQILLKTAAVEPHGTNAASVDGADGADAGRAGGRWAAMARRPWLWLGVACFVVEFLLWLAFVSLVPLSEGVLLGAVNVVAITVFGRLFFSEKLSRLRLAGILLISVGVAVVGLR